MCRASSFFLITSLYVLRLISLPTVSITAPQVNVLQFWSYWRQFFHLWSHRRDLEPHPSRVGNYLLRRTSHLGKDKLRMRQGGQVDSKKMNAGNSSDVDRTIEAKPVPQKVGQNPLTTPCQDVNDGASHSHRSCPSACLQDDGPNLLVYRHGYIDFRYLHTIFYISIHLQDFSSSNTYSFLLRQLCKFTVAL